MIVLDTTVLVYAKGADHPLREPCRELVNAIAEGRLDATTTVEVIQEFVHVRAQRRGRSDAAALGSDYADLLTPLLSVSDQHLRRGLTLFERNERLGAFDACWRQPPSTWAPALWSRRTEPSPRLPA